MIETAASSTGMTDYAVRQFLSPAREDSDAFSYALAAAALEKNAARALDAHGAMPASDGTKASPANSAVSAHSKGLGQSQDVTTSSKDALRSSADAAPTSRRTPQTIPLTQPLVTATAATTAPAATPAPGVAAATAKAADVATPRANAVDEKAKAPQKAARAPSEPAALKTEFAEILAKRLEKSSVFDLRLDPPALGRVEGRLTVGDDGTSVLALSFDNQTAFDLLSRDEQALRQALVQAGLDFGAGDFTFSFRARPESAPSSAGVAAAIEPRAYDPVFLADWSAGALDIRI